MSEMTFEEEHSEGASSGFLSHLPEVLWQRRWWIIVPTVLGLTGALAAILLITPTYRSTAIMLVESSQLPGDVLGQPGDDVVDRRIASIREQVTSRPDLVSLIQRHSLYTRERRTKSLSKVIQKMRDDITLEPTASVEVPGQVDKRTIAFQLAFDYQEPNLAQAVAQDLMDKVLELDAAGNVEQATNTEQFLAEQAKGLEGKISQVQGQITAISSRNGGVLSNGSVAIMGGSSGSYDIQISSLQRDNATLLSQRQNALTSDRRDPVVVAAETSLAAARAVYSENHPDVVIAKQRLAEARELAKSNAQQLPLESIDQQIAFNNAQISALRATKAREQSDFLARMSAQGKVPLVQQQIANLEKTLEGLNKQYETVQERLMAARAGVRAEDEQLSERLSIVDPPVAPDEPTSPNRLLLLGGGVGGGLGLGLILALAIEILLSPIRDPQALMAITGRQPLGMIPLINDKHQRKGRLRIFGRRSRKNA